MDINKMMEDGVLKPVGKVPGFVDQQRLMNMSISKLADELSNKTVNHFNDFLDRVVAASCNRWVKMIPVEAELEEFVKQITDERNSAALLSIRAQTIKAYGEIYEYE